MQVFAHRPTASAPAAPAAPAASRAMQPQPQPPPFAVQAPRPRLPARLPSVGSTDSSAAGSSSIIRLAAAGGVGPAAQPIGAAQSAQHAAAARAGPTSWQRRAGEQPQQTVRPAWPPPPQPQQHGQQVQQQQQQQHQQAQSATASSRPLVPVAASAARHPFALLQPAPPAASLASQQHRPPLTPSQQQRDRPPTESSVSAASAPASASASAAAPSQQLALVRRAPQQTALTVQEPLPQSAGASSTVTLPVLLVHTSLVEACTQTDAGRGRGGASGSGGNSGSGLSGGGLSSLFELLPMHFQLRESASIAADIVRPAFPSFKLFIQREEELDLAFRRAAAVKRSLSGLSVTTSTPLAELLPLHRWLTFSLMRVDALFPQDESSGCSGRPRPLAAVRPAARHRRTPAGQVHGPAHARVSWHSRACSSLPRVAGTNN